MRGSPITVGLIAAALSMAAALPSQAADFVFNVKVDFQTMHQDAKAVEIKCDARVSTPTSPFTPIEGEASHDVGSGRLKVTIDPVTRSFKGTVTISFDALAGRDAALADNYQCLILYIDCADDSAYLPIETGKVPPGVPCQQYRKDKPSRHIILGEIPPS